MKKFQANSARASTLQIALSIILLSFSAAVFLTSTFAAAPSKGSDATRNFAKLSPNPVRPSQSPQLSLADRVGYQRAIEEVYWRHRTWSKERSDSKPALDQLVSPAQLEKKVLKYLRNSQALEDYWQPIRPEQLQREIERMALDTRQPEVLSELFQALGNDPFLIAECLARPLLSERLARSLYSSDQRFHGELKRQAEVAIQNYRGVEQLKQTSGVYSETRWIKSDLDQKERNRDQGTDIPVDGYEWLGNVRQLEGVFGSAITQIKPEELSRLQEDQERYYVVALLKQTNDQLRIATIEWRKVPFDAWIARAENGRPTPMAALEAEYSLPILAPACSDNTWTDTSTFNAPMARYAHSAVWTGSEMIIWGGSPNGGHSILNTGGRYDPSTDSWTTTSTVDAPVGGYNHTAVWTGTEMIVWGGLAGQDPEQFLSNGGGRYNPISDTWTATSTVNAPEGRSFHTAVWTGDEMIVWGGRYFTGYFASGGKYNPGTNRWTAMSDINAPAARSGNTTIWTGSRMIVWGGGNNNGPLNTGGRYDPTADNWVATDTVDAPTARSRHTAVWTNSHMIVWGGGNGDFASTGGNYDPTTDSWTTTSNDNAPLGRIYFTSIWTGNEMIVWGGILNGSATAPGGRYDPSTDGWVSTLTPPDQYYHTAVWTGSQMIVWGGWNSSFSYLNTGGRYCAHPPPNPTPIPSPTPTPSASATATPPPSPTPTPSPIPPTPTPSPTPLAILVDTVSLPIAFIATTVTNFTQPIVTTAIDADDQLVGFQGDFTFDSTVVSFQNPPVSPAELTPTNWSVAGNVLPGGGAIRTLRFYGVANDGITPLSGSGPLINLNMVRVSSTPDASTALSWKTAPDDFIFIDTELRNRPPGNTPPGSISVGDKISISGAFSYCSNPPHPAVPNVTLTLSGSGSSSTLSDNSSHYQFSALQAGGNYLVTPTKTALTPASAGITIIDVLTVQRHFLGIGPSLSTCQLAAADVNGDAAINTADISAMGRFYLGLSTGIANTGQYQFTPPNRTYSGVISNPNEQNYETLVFGDVAARFVEPSSGGLRGDGTTTDEVPATVAIIALPEVTVDSLGTNVSSAATTSAISGSENLVGFQGDFTFDERVIGFESEPVRKAGLTSGNWTVAGNVLPGKGPIRTLRIAAYSNDFTPLSGSGALFELRMKPTARSAQGTPLIWGTAPNDFIFINADLQKQRPGHAPPGNVASSARRD